MSLMEHPTHTGPINLGNPGEFTVLELAEKCIRLTGAKVNVVRRPMPADDPKQRRPDIDRARAVLGFEPRIALDVGLDRTVGYFRRELGL